MKTHVNSRLVDINECGSSWIGADHFQVDSGEFRV
jgi:hypothetical protein